MCCTRLHVLSEGTTLGMLILEGNAGVMMGCEHVGSCTFDPIWPKSDPKFPCVTLVRPNVEAGVWAEQPKVTKLDNC